MKAGGVTRTVSETEMIALLKRQQAKVSSSSTAAQLTSAQILAQAGLQVMIQNLAFKACLSIVIIIYYIVT